MDGEPLLTCVFHAAFGAASWHHCLKNRCSAAAGNRLLETHIPALFHTASTLSAPSEHLPLEGKATFVRIVFLHVSCIRFDDARKAASLYRSLLHWEGKPRSGG